MRLLVRSVLLLIVLFGASFPFVSSAGNLETYQDYSDLDYSLWVQQKYPDPGQLEMQWILPEGTITFKYLYSYLCYDLRENAEVRYNLYWYDEPEDNWVLTAFSNWVTILGEDDNCYPSWSPTSDQEYEFDFGTYNTLVPGRLYGLTLTERGNVDSTELNVALVDVIDKGYSTTTYIGVGNYEALNEYDPWRLGDFSTTTFGASRYPLIDWYAFAIRSSVFSELENSLYLSLEEVTAFTSTTSDTNVDCFHDSNQSSYYSYCFFIGTDYDSLSFEGSYIVPNEFYYIDYRLLDGSSLPLPDDSYTYTFFPEDLNGDWFAGFSLPVSDTNWEYVFRGCAMPIVTYATSTYDVACTQTYITQCETEEECWTNYYEYTRSGDGVTVSLGDPTAFGTVADLLETPLSFAYGIASSTLHYMFPFNIVYEVYDSFSIYRDGFSTTTAMQSTTSAFYIGLDMSDFGLPATDTGIPLSAMAYTAKEQSPMTFEIIDTILWGIFVLFLTGRVIRGTWQHGLEYGSSEAKQTVNITREALNTRGASRIGRGVIDRYFIGGGR